MHPAAETLVRRDYRLAVDQKIEQQPVLPVTADPDPVDEPLIVSVDRDRIFAGTQESGDVDPIVKVVERVTGRRPLRDERAVHVKLVIVVGGDADLGGIDPVERELPPEQDMPILQFGIDLRQRRPVQLAVKHILHDKVAELRRGDPAPFENLRFLFHCGLPHWLVMSNIGLLYPFAERIASFTGKFPAKKRRDVDFRRFPGYLSRRNEMTEAES